MILGPHFERATGQEADEIKRSDGAAFLKAAASLYNLSALDYLSLNLPLKRRSDALLQHCLHGASGMRQKLSRQTVGHNSPPGLHIFSDVVIDWREHDHLREDLNRLACELDDRPQELNALTVPITTNHGETALFGIVANSMGPAWEQMKSLATRDLRILMTYYHSHMLRLTGTSAEADMLISARELDCLKWTAAGKTAWEASRILGISERTVRFHLNSAREKMNCANTTQAVAKAISENWIVV